jgi:hypothetical protein
MMQAMKAFAYRNYQIAEFPQCWTLTDPGGIMVKAYPPYEDMAVIHKKVDDLIASYN